MFAIIDIGSKQYKVRKGDRLSVDKLAGEGGKILVFDRVLLLSDGQKTKIGTPTVKGAKVTAKILAQKKGTKIDVRRFKSKVRQRRHIGFRPQVTELEILAVE